MFGYNSAKLDLEVTKISLTNDIAAQEISPHSIDGRLISLLSLPEGSSSMAQSVSHTQSSLPKLG